MCFSSDTSPRFLGVGPCARSVIVAVTLFWGTLFACPLAAQKFFADDPLEKEPPPLPVQDANVRELSQLREQFQAAIVGLKGELHPATGVIPARGVNTLGEVPDGPWYVNRHGRKRMTIKELVRGPGRGKPPNPNFKWEALTVKKYGAFQGILISDADGNHYVLRFDPPGHPEMETGAEMVASRLFWALGYWTKEVYIVRFERDQLRASEIGDAITSHGKKRFLSEEDIDHFLFNVPRDRRRGYRAVAWTWLPDAKVLGPFHFYGTRSDDPNDTVPHEHRRDLRGLRVFSGWLNHHRVNPLTTLDVLVEEDGIPRIRHHLMILLELSEAALGGPRGRVRGTKNCLAGVPPLATFSASASAGPAGNGPDIPICDPPDGLNTKFSTPRSGRRTILSHRSKTCFLTTRFGPPNE